MRKPSMPNKMMTDISKKVINSHIAVTLTIVMLCVLSLMGSAHALSLSKNKLSLSEITLEQTLAEHQGQVIYLDFWASWCGPCRKSFPWMNQMQQKYRAQGLVIISVNLDANKALAQTFLSKNAANFPVIYDPDGDIAQHFEIKGMPSSLLIDRHGQIQQAHSGFFTNKIKLYETQLTALLATKEE